jgi:hypothetical protein
MGEQTGVEKLQPYWSWQPLIKLLFQGGIPQTIKIGRRQWAYRKSLKKLSHAPGIKLICGPGPKVKRFYIDKTNNFNIVVFKRSIITFLNIVAAHIGGQTHPPKCLFKPFFRVRMSLKPLQPDAV